MNRRNFLRSGALLLAASTLLAGNGVVSAHEHRTVGDYSMVVGFLNEPAVQDEVNAVSVRITKPAPADATPAAGEDDVAETPITGLTLNVDVILGDQQVSLPMEAKWGDPGHYVAYFIPTQPGDYSFHVTGEIDGVAVDETFTAGPETFSTVRPRARSSSSRRSPSRRSHESAGRSRPALSSGHDMQSLPTILRSLGALAMTAAMIALLNSGSALAHATPERTNPTMNTAVPVMPSTIEIWFSEEVKPEGTTVQVLRLDGTQVDQGNAGIDLKDPTRTRVTVGMHDGLDNGEYLVQWTAVSAIDGDATSGSYQFTVDPAASPAALPQIVAQQAPVQPIEIDAQGDPVDTSRNPLLYGIVAAATGVAFIGLIIFWFFRRASRGRRWSDRPLDRL